VIATIVDTTALWQTVVAAFVAGVGTTVVFSLAILGATRSSQANRDGQAAHAALYAMLGILGVLATLAAVVAAVIVMTSK